jgi:hypothetical protein
MSEDLVGRSWRQRALHAEARAEQFMKERDTALLALASSRDGWRTFESAPKDGSYILAVVAPGRGRHLEYHAGRVFVIRYEGLTRTDHMGWAVYPGFGGASDHDFTHWMPLPPPPVKERGL